MPWLQAKLDQFRHRFNNSRCRHQKHKILPQGRVPDYIHENPEEFDARDYKVSKGITLH